MNDSIKSIFKYQISNFKDLKDVGVKSLNS